MHDFEMIKQYRSVYLSLIKKHSDYSKEVSCWAKEIMEYKVSLDQDFSQLFPYQKFIEVENEVEKMMKVLRWVNERLMYPKQEECSEPLSAKNILKHVQDKKVTVNCLSHAIVLNECLHQLGIVSRIVFCCPIDFIPKENHVIVHAYCKQYAKWIALDPSWNCYYCDSEGEIMSLQEIRKAIVADLPFHIQYNHREIIGAKASPYKEYFIWENLYSYLCKNLFRFSYISSTYDKDIVIYELVPNTILENNKEVIEIKEDYNIIRRFITNECEFWNVPTYI